MEQIITLEVAKLAKINGFNVSIRKYYDKNNKLCIGKDSTGPKEDWDYNTSFIGWCSAPTQSILQAWLRTKNIHMYTKVFYDSIEKKTSYTCDGLLLNGGHVMKSPLCESYEGALEYALKEVLNLIKI